MSDPSRDREVHLIAPDPALPDLARRINDAHRQAQAAMQSGLARALDAGRLLLEAKAACGHGAWGAWLATNVECSARTAQAYMRIARHWTELGKNAGSADLSLDGALRLLASPPAPPALVAGGDNRDERDCVRFETLPLAARRELVLNWPDIRLAYVLLFDAEGLSIPEIAQVTLGREIEQDRAKRAVMSRDIPDDVVVGVV
jgi:hypothetical protein